MIKPSNTNNGAAVPVIVLSSNRLHPLIFIIGLLPTKPEERTSTPGTSPFKLSIRLVAPVATKSSDFMVCTAPAYEALERFP